MGEMNTELASPSHPQLPPPSPQAIPTSSRQPTNPAAPPSSSSSKPQKPKRPSRNRRHSLPFTFPPLFFQPTNSSSTSLVPSTAEGRPIPLDDTTAAHRTSALRQLNNNYPSQVNRHRYAKSSGAQSSTYSQPVIVRTYSGPSPAAQGPYSSSSHHYRPPSSNRGGSRRVPFPSSSRSHWSFSGRPIKPTVSGVGSSGSGTPSASKHGHLASMPRPQTKQSGLSWRWRSSSRRRAEEEAKLPPLDAFSFKSFMAELQAQDGASGGIGADLDRIAEICARSRYSLSNQYEVHLAPHGSGAAFLSAGPSGGRRKGNAQAQAVGGPTLQAINPDDEDGPSRGHRKRRSGARRKSVAYGTLETIMSSSRSSEEEKNTKKKSAAEIADEVRGRASRNKAKLSADSEPGATPIVPSPSQDGDPGNALDAAKASGENNLTKKKSASFASAVMDSTRQTNQLDAVSPRSSANALLLSEPAQPQTSTSHLEIRTSPDDTFPESQRADDLSRYTHVLDRAEDAARPSAHAEGPRQRSSSTVSGWDTWIPWRTTTNGEYNTSGIQRAGSSKSHAEGSLRQLLKSSDARDKGKAVDRDIQAKKSLEN